jgi:L-arabinonolactonase
MFGRGTSMPLTERSRIAVSSLIYRPLTVSAMEPPWTAEGCYWLTMPYQGKVQRYDPKGELMQTIELPTDAPTCCEFGGKDLEVLYVTTATLRRTPEELKNQPMAGGLFAIDARVKGLSSVPFKG